MTHLSARATRIKGVKTVPIRLADNQLWGFAREDLYVRPIIVPATDPDAQPTIEVETFHGFPARTETQLKPLRDAFKVDPQAVPLSIIYLAAAALLRQAHHLSLPQAMALLELSGDRFPSLLEAISLAFETAPAPEPEPEPKI